MIRFNIYIGNDKRVFNDNIRKIRSGPIYQPELSTYLYYGNNELQALHGYITINLLEKKFILELKFFK